jgi:hypothetical protein
MNVNRQPKPGMPWVENVPALRHMGVLLSPSITDGVPIRRSAGRRRTRRISARSRRLRQRQRNAMTEQACEFVDNRLRRCPPDRAGAVPYGQAGENALRFPHLAHRSAAAHKLHSATATSRIEFDSGKGETLQPATGLSLFFPEPVQTTGTTAPGTRRALIERRCWSARCDARPFRQAGLNLDDARWPVQSGDHSTTPRTQRPRKGKSDKRPARRRQMADGRWQAVHRT